DTTGEFTVTLAGDNLNEATENFSVAVSVPPTLASETAIGAAAAVAVTDDDALTVTLPAAAQVTEGQALSVSAVISGAEVNGEVELTWATAPGSATIHDFTTAGGTLTAADAADTFDLSVQTTADGAPAEPGETFTITASATAVGAVTVANTPLTVTIIDRTVGLGLRRDTSAGALTESAGEVAYTVSLLSFGSGGRTLYFNTVDLSVVPASGGVDGATAGDYRVTAPTGLTVDSGGARRGRLRLVPPHYNANIRLSILDDRLLENTEAFTVTVAVPGTGGAVSASDTVTITDNETAAADLARTDRDGFAEGAAGAGGEAEFTVTVTGATLSADADFAFTVAGCGPGCTFAPASPLRIGAGRQSGVITVGAGPDDAAAEMQDIVVTVTAVDTPGAVTGLPASASARLSEDDYLEAGVTAAAVDVAEAGGATVVFDLALSAAVARDVVVIYQLGGDAARGADYSGHGVAATQTAETDYAVAFDAGDTAAQLAFTLADEGAAEADETLRVTVTEVRAPGYQTRPQPDAATAETTILDAQPRLAAACPAITESDAAQTVTCTVARSRGEFAAETTVNWTLAYDTASAADFTGATAGSVTFAPGDDEETFQLTIAGDGINEAAEHFSVATGGHAATVNHAPAARVAIADDDRIAVTVSATATAVVEGGNAVVNIDLGAIPSRQVTIDYSFGSKRSGLASTAADDDVDASLSADLGAVTPANSRVTVAAATDPPTATLTIPVTADNLNEGAETFQVLTTAADIEGAHGPATVAAGGALTFTIAASDPLTASVAADSATANEGGTAAFTVTLSGASNGSAAAITVPYTVTSSGAYHIAPAARSGSVSIAAGRTSAGFTLALPFNAAFG
ncbi:MAG: hypothetical protein OXU22_09515, partial [Gammaproteobacteria bacterium]|nr:hypothetical protein [Gammaproteobacteria bacterium]